MNILNDIQYADRFKARINLGNLLPSINTDYDLNEFSFNVKSFNIPNSSIEYKDLNYFGKKKKIAVNKTYDSINITFIDAEKLRLREVFEQWSNKIFNYSSGKMEYYDNYSGVDLVLFAYGYMDEESNATKITFRNVTIENISDINFEKSAADTLVEFSVSFNFYDFDIEIQNGFQNNNEYVNENFSDPGFANF